MVHLEVSYDRQQKVWEVFRPSARVLCRTSRVVVDHPCRSKGRKLLCDLPDEALSGDATLMRLGKPAPLPGVRKDHEMREWVAVHDEITGLWSIWRQDREAVLVTTWNLQIECHAVTSEGRLHCLAEMLVDGRTNRHESISVAREVRLRTLCVYDQTIEVPIVSFGGASRRLG